jgi:hypothetical protein
MIKIKIVVYPWRQAEREAEVEDGEESRWGMSSIPTGDIFREHLFAKGSSKYNLQATKPALYLLSKTDELCIYCQRLTNLVTYNQIPLLF